MFPTFIHNLFPSSALFFLENLLRHEELVVSSNVEFKISGVFVVSVSDFGAFFDKAASEQLIHLLTIKRPVVLLELMVEKRPFFSFAVCGEKLLEDLVAFSVCEDGMEGL